MDYTSESKVQLARLEARLREMQEEAWEEGCSTSEMFPHFQSMCARKCALEAAVEGGK